MMTRSLTIFLGLTATAWAFTGPLPARSCARTHIVASASGDYLASTQKSVDVSQAAAEVAKIMPPKEFARDPEQFKRDPELFKRGAKGDVDVPAQSEVTTEALGLMAVSVVSLIALLTYPEMTLPF